MKVYVVNGHIKNCIFLYYDFVEVGIWANIELLFNKEICKIYLLINHKYIYLFPLNK